MSLRITERNVDHKTLRGLKKIENETEENGAIESRTHFRNFAKFFI